MFSNKQNHNSNVDKNIKKLDNKIDKNIDSLDTVSANTQKLLREMKKQRQIQRLNSIPPSIRVRVLRVAMQNKISRQPKQGFINKLIYGEKKIKV